MQQVTQSSNKMASSPLVIAEFQGNLQELETRDCKGRRSVSHLTAGNFEEAARRQRKSGSQQLLHLRFCLFSQNLLSSLLSQLSLLHRQQQITKPSTRLSGLISAVEAVVSHGWKRSQPSQQAKSTLV